MHTGFQKGYSPWNKGKRGGTSWNKGMKKTHTNNVICKVCGKEFWTKPCLVSVKKYCSRKCKHMAMSKLLKGNKNGFKKGLIPWNKELHIYLGGGIKKGNIPWNKDLKGPEYKKHYPNGFKGLVHAAGDQHPNWRSGRTPLHYRIRYSPFETNWIRKVFLRDDFTCQDCGVRGGKLEAHHIKAFSIILAEFLKLYSHLSPIEDKQELVVLAYNYAPFWDISNGKTLCEECHKKVKRIISEEI
jgi:5-methylcytosine-specific restriction endonuclease McrA